MVPCFLANPWLGSWPPQVSVQGLPYSDRQYIEASLTLPVVPCLYIPATEPQDQEESRRFILDRSVFDLVDSHGFLSLTDSRLLSWYLSLSPQDRRIVQAEGGFRQFLQNHPALQVTKRHVYVKCSSGGSRPVQPMSKLSLKSGGKTTGCEPAHTHLELEMFPRDLTLLGCRNTTGEHLCSSQQSLLDLDRCSQRPKTRSHVSAAGDQNVPCSEARPSRSDWPAASKEPSESRDVNVVQTNSSSEDRCQDYLLQRDQFPDEDQTENIPSIMEDDQSILICSPQATMSPSQSTCDANVGSELLLRTSTSTQTRDPETADKHVITEVHMSDLDYLAEEFIKLKATEGQKEKIKRPDCGCTERAQKAELSLVALQYNICRHHIWRLYWEGKQLSSQNKGPPENVAEVLDQLDSDYQEMKRQILAGVPLEQLKPLSVDSGKIISGRYTPSQMAAGELGNVRSRTSEEPQQLHAAAEHSRSPDDGSRNSSQIKKKVVKTRRAAAVILKDGRFLQNNKQEGSQTAAGGEEVNRSELWFDAEEDLELHKEDLELHKEDLELHKEDLELHKENLELHKEILELPEVGQNPAAEPADVEGSVVWVSNLPSDVTKTDLMLLFMDYEASEIRLSALKDDQRVAMVTVSGPQAAEAAVEDLDGRRLENHSLHVEHISRNVVQKPENLQDPPRPGPSENLQDPSRPGPSENLQDPSRPGPSENLQDPPRPGPSEILQDPPRPGPSEILQDLPRPGPSENLQDPPRPGPSENRPSSPGRTPLISRSRKVVFISPTARRTSVPQHYGTMSSFDTLMSDLLQLHPEVDRQQIMEALVELRRLHPGVLTGLPLQTIREMTSQLLRPETTSQI